MSKYLSLPVRNKLLISSGMIPPDFDPRGTCSAGYQGILCSDCQAGYSITGSFECSKCPEYIQNIMRLTALILAAVIVVVFMIRSTLNGALEKKNVTSIFQKILLNHL